MPPPPPPPPPGPLPPGLGPDTGYSRAGDLETPHDKLTKACPHCPACGGGLEKGYILSGASMEWRQQILQRKPGEKLTPTARAGRGFELPAYRCRACGFIAAQERR